MLQYDGRLEKKCLDPSPHYTCPPSSTTSFLVLVVPWSLYIAGGVYSPQFSPVGFEYFTGGGGGVRLTGRDRPVRAALTLLAAAFPVPWTGHVTSVGVVRTERATTVST